MPITRCFQLIIIVKTPLEFLTIYVLTSHLNFLVILIKNELKINSSHDRKNSVDALNILVVTYMIDAVTSSEILKAKQKLGVTFNFDKQDVIDFMKFSKMTMCRASEANSEK